MDLLEQLKTSVVQGNALETKALVSRSIEEGMPAQAILNQGLVAGMTEVGCLFSEGEYFVPDMLVAALAMKGGLELLRPRLVAANVQAIGKVVIGTVQGDVHDIGKNLVGMMLEGAGFEVIDLGVDVSPQKFATAVKAHHPDVLALSALLTSTMVQMRATVDELKAAGVRDQVKVLVGGAPITQAYADAIGANAYAADGASAAKLARAWVNM